MSTRKTRIAPWGLVLPVLLVISLTACGSSAADATPTLGVEAVFTMAFQTFTANEATQLALTPPTPVPSPTLLPTLPPPPTLATFSLASPTFSTGGKTCNNATYVSDVTIPDNTTIAAGKKFDKTWQLLNSGSCAWSTSYRLVFSSGDAMGGVTTYMTASVGAGSVANITVPMVAPSSDGNYTGRWQMQNDQGVSFGNSITVVIKVGNGGLTATSGPTLSPSDLTATASAGPPSGGPFTISGETGAVDVTISWIGKGIDTSQVFSGTWSITVPAHWDGTVTPKKGSYVFSPASFTYTDVTTNKHNQDFTASSP